MKVPDAQSGASSRGHVHVCRHQPAVNISSSMSWTRWEGGSLSNTGMSTSVFRFDLKTLPVDFVECLMRFLPTENEVKVLRLYERERKPLENLSDEDRFMMQFSKIERLMQKMTIMAFIGNFTESIQMLTPVSGPALARAWRGTERENFLLFSFMVLAELHFMSWTLRCFPRTFKMAFLFSPSLSPCICQVNFENSEFPYSMWLFPPENAISCVCKCPLDFK